MKIKYFIFSVFLFFAGKALAQKDTATYYLTADGKQVPTKEHGDFIVKISPPGPVGNPKLYIVDGYYNHGEKLFHTTSLSSSFPLKLQGAYTTYFQNGNKMSERNFDHGEITGDQILYYPNGRLYDKVSKEITMTDTVMHYQECRDSIGKILTENGNGHWITYNDDFSGIVAQGKVVNGQQDSIWSVAGPYNKFYPVQFKNGKQVQDSSTNKIFTVVDQMPEFPGGSSAFGRFIALNLRYPAIARENNTQGTVIIGFVVEKDGSLGDIKIIRAIGDGCDEEATRVIKQCPKWKPGILNGKPVRVQYSIPINFSLKAIK